MAEDTKGLEDYGATEIKEAFFGGSSAVFKHEVGSTTIVFGTESKPRKSIFITNIETLPKNARRRGGASSAVSSFVQWAQSQGYEDIFAQRVTKSETIAFWEKNGFIRKEEPNYNNLYKYVG